MLIYQFFNVFGRNDKNKEVKFFLHQIPHKFHTEIFGGTFFYIYFSWFLLDIRLLDLNFVSVFGEILVPSV